VQVIAVPDWRTHYGELLDDIADAVQDVPDLDLTAELITSCRVLYWT
jgi:spore photoproduct lyase